MATLRQALPEAPLNSTGDQNDAAARRLWFDYLVKVNDRSLQKNAASGLTTWVLLGVIGAILYRGLLSLPTFLNQPRLLISLLVFGAFQFNVLISLAAIIAILHRYITGKKSETRLLPDTARRLRNVQFSFARAFVLVVGCLNIGVAVRLHWPIWGRLVAGILGLVWVGTIILPIFHTWKVRQKQARQVRGLNAIRKGIVAPQFFADNLSDSNLIIMFVAVVISSLLSVAAILAYVSIFGMKTGTWVKPLGAATYFVVFTVIVIELLFRGLYSSAAGVYESLERAIVVENLAADEIRSRFVNQLLGSKGSEWLRSLCESSIKLNNEFVSKLDGISQRLDEVESLDLNLAFERKGRAAELLQELDAAIQNIREALKTFVVHVLEYPTQNNSQDEIDTVSTIAKEVQAKMDEWKTAGTRGRELRERIARIAG